jgi:hypothetical protein
MGPAVIVMGNPFSQYQSQLFLAEWNHEMQTLWLRKKRTSAANDALERTINRKYRSASLRGSLTIA